MLFCPLYFCLKFPLAQIRKLEYSNMKLSIVPWQLTSSSGPGSLGVGFVAWLHRQTWPQRKRQGKIIHAVSILDFSSTSWPGLQFHPVTASKANSIVPTCVQLWIGRGGSASRPAVYNIISTCEKYRMLISVWLLSHLNSPFQNAIHQFRSQVYRRCDLYISGTDFGWPQSGVHCVYPIIRLDFLFCRFRSGYAVWDAEVESGTGDNFGL